MFLTARVKVTEIKKCDLVKCRDIVNKIDRYREVLATMEPYVDDQIQISAGEYSICTSTTHPMAYYVDGKEQYTESGNINIGDTIITPEGYKQVDNIEQGDYSKNFIDFTIDEDNNYYAGNNDTNLILAHNSATLYFPIWHLEVEDLLVLKNNKGTEETRIRTLDYGVQMNKLMYERLLTGGDITLFSPHDVPDLYDAFYADQDKFRKLYEMYERKTSIRKVKVKAMDLFSTFIQERKDTGRMYLMNVDHANEHGSFKPDLAPIKMSNLCSEIDLPTKPLNDFNDEEGEIALCSLSAINWGAFKKPEDMERACNLAVRGLDSLLSYQDYPVKAAQIATENRRPLGVGIINLAYFLAKHGVGYNDKEGVELVDTWAQHWSYYLIKASNELAQEEGACPLSNETKYSDGILPIDTYKKEVDEVIKHKNKMDWNGLRKNLKKHGIRNSTLMALMPSETSSQISNATNGIEPPRSYVSIKQSKDGVMAQVVPEFRHLKNKYELLWDQPGPSGYLKVMAVLQKYIDQGISVNTSYNPLQYDGEKIPMSKMLEDIITFYKYGGKQLYYFQTYDGAGEVTVEDDADCDSCKI